MTTCRSNDETQGRKWKPAQPWFRMYHEWADDPKVQMLSEAMQRRFIMLLCLKCKGAVPGLSDDQIAFNLRVSPEDVTETKQVLVERDLVTEEWDIPKWDKRQFQSDISTERSRKHRQRKRQSKGKMDSATLQQRDDAVAATGPEQNRAEQNRTEQTKTDQTRHKRHPPTPLGPES